MNRNQPENFDVEKETALMYARLLLERYNGKWNMTKHFKAHTNESFRIFMESIHYITNLVELVDLVNYMREELPTLCYSGQLGSTKQCETFQE